MVLSQSFNTVKARSQSARATTTMQGVGSVLVEDEGWGFWKGTVVRLSRRVFSGW
jgi:solute carrier family 25 citrate transporter 1